jgi:hypothetical protein
MDIDYQVDIDEMIDTLKLANPRIVKNVGLITPETLGVSSLLHIAMNKRPVLYPSISKRAGQTEDNTLPRVHVSVNLAGCWFGYASGGFTAASERVSDTDKKQAINKAAPSVYKGGYYIHQIPYRCALKPNKALVYDSDFTDEMWLVTYNKLNRVFPAEIVGILFPCEVSFTPQTGSTPVEITTLCVKIEPGKQVNLSLNNQYQKPSDTSPEFITEGFYKFNISVEFGITDFTKIKEREFDDLKLKSAALLSYQ